MPRLLDSVRDLAISKKRWIASCAFYAPAALVLFLNLQTMLRATQALHSDGLWVFSFAHDLMSGTPIHGWKPSALPLYFPELASVLTWRSLGFSVRATMMIHGTASWLLIGSGVWWGTRLCGLAGPQALTSAFFVLLANQFLHCGHDLVATFHNPFSHGGSTLGLFLGVIFVGHGLRDGYGTTRAVVGAVCLALLVASDLLIIAQFILPAALGLVLFGLLSWAPRRRLFESLGILAIGLLGGRLITLAIRSSTGLVPQALPTDYTWAAARLTFLRLTQDMVLLGGERPLLLIGTLLPVVLLVRAVLTCGAQRWHHPGTLDGVALARWWMACMSVMTLGATLGAVVLTHSWFGLASHRYLLPLLVLPIAFATIVLAPRLFPLPRGVVRTVEVGLLLMATVAAKRNALPDAASASPERPQYVCLGQYAKQLGLQAGLAQFWQARPSTLLSAAAFTINQVDARWQPYFWLNNAFWYSRGYWPDGKRQLSYDFTVINGLDTAWIAERFGTPRVNHSCFDLEIWVYDRPTDVEFRNYLRTYAARATGDQQGWSEATAFVSPSDGPRKSISFDGGEGTTLSFPRMSGNVLELTSPTRQPLALTYRRGGVDLAQQVIEFSNDARRLVALPKQLGALGFDAVHINGRAGFRHEVSDAALMADPYSEGARP